jgi:hypothetical protein
MKTKYCSRCGRTLLLSDFNKNITKPDGLSNVCRDCNKSNLKQHYLAHKRHYYLKNLRRRHLLKEWLDEQKRNLYCRQCKESEVCCLVFHHKDSSKKEYNISKMINRLMSVKKIKEEMEKCEVLCFNCHAKIHFKRE